jgi:3-polyprenyl-4-hydroxybenzoate decarboxylase
VLGPMPRARRISFGMVVVPCSVTTVSAV